MMSSSATVHSIMGMGTAPLNHDLAANPRRPKPTPASCPSSAKELAHGSPVMPSGQNASPWACAVNAMTAKSAPASLQIRLLPSLYLDSVFLVQQQTASLPPAALREPCRYGRAIPPVALVHRSIQPSNDLGADKATNGYHPAC